MARSASRLLLIGGCLLLLAGISWYIIGLFQYQYAPLPSYRSAERMRVWEEEVAALPHGEVRGKKRTIIFQTQDAPEVVLAFYQTELLSQGWEISSRSSTASQQLKFLWNHGRLEQHQALIVTVYTNDPKQQQVSIVQWPSLGLES